MPVAERVERRRLDVAVALVEARAARMEAAGGRRVERARHVALENDLLARAPSSGFGIGTAESSAPVYGCFGSL